MKLKSISVTNFRQFWHEVEIKFSTEEQKNITVVHGANGAGKTSLLNAFKWCFYGKTDFDTNTDNILNESAIKVAEIGDEIELKVKVKFEEDDCLYEVVRTEKYERKNSFFAENLNVGEFFIYKTDVCGSMHKIEMANSEINKVLPESLQPYFFFNGERIEKIAGVNESNQIKEAIKRLMGLKQIERAQRHLEKAARVFMGEVAKNLDDDTQKLYKRIDGLESDIENKKRKQEKETQAIKDIEQSITNIDKELELHKELKFHQSERQRLNDENTLLEQYIESNLQKRKELIDRNHAILMAKPIIDRCSRLVEENRRKGILPYKIRTSFINDLIHAKTCLCGRKLDDASIQVLENTKKSAGNDNLDIAYTYVSGFINSFPLQESNYISDVESLVEQNNGYILKRDQNIGEISEISAKLQGSDNRKISNLESRRVELISERDSRVYNLKRLNDELPVLISELEKERKAWDKLQEKQKTHNVTQKRLNSTQNIVNVLKELNVYFTETVRNDLSNRVGETFSKIIRKNMTAFIDSDFSLKVEKNFEDGSIDVREQSTGEKQVTSLSFIASIISLAKDKHTSKGKFFKGGLYPLVMDSPFGSLDDDYRYKIAQNVSELADQVIIFVSNSQWNGNVRRACEDKLGRCYKLVHYSNSLAAKSSENSDFMRFTDQSKEYSVVEEVELK